MELNTEITFAPSTISVSEQEIAAFERRMSYRIPIDYRHFLKLFNGPQARRRTPALESHGESLTLDLRGIGGLSDLESCDVSHWIGFADPNADYPYGLVEQYDVATKEWGFPKSLLPIATSLGPTKYYLNLERGSGHILIAGDEVIDRQDDERELRVCDFVVVAESFRLFVAELKWAPRSQWLACRTPLMPC